MKSFSLYAGRQTNKPNPSFVVGSRREAAPSDRPADVPPAGAAEAFSRCLGYFSSAFSLPLVSSWTVSPVSSSSDFFLRRTIRRMISRMIRIRAAMVP